MGKMKRLSLFLVTMAAMAAPLAASEAASSSGHGTSAMVSPLSDEDRLLPFSRNFLKIDEQGHGYLLIHGEPLSVGRLLALSPWDLMEVVQVLSGKEVPLSRFGNGDEVTQAWRTKVASFAASGDVHTSDHTEDLFDPALVLWDPGYIQNLNSWGQWTIRLDRRDIVQSDLASLSPLEVQQAVEVLTGRTYPVEFVLEHLEAFRAQLSVVPRLAEATGDTHH